MDIRPIVASGGGGGGAPSGPAGGSLAGTYPNPTVADGADGSAIHDNIASEISAVAVKATPAAGDMLLIEDSAAGNAKKRITVGSLPTDAPSGPAGGSLTGTYPNPGVASGADGTAIHSTVAGEIAGVTAKAVPVAADTLLIEDSAAGNVKKRITIGSLPTDAPSGPAGGDLAGTYPDPTVVASSETVAGKIELATQAETDTGTDDLRAVTPLKLKTTPLSGRDTTAIHSTVAGEIAGVAAKATPVAADLVLIEDSAAGSAKKKATLGTLPVKAHAASHLPAAADPIAGESLGVAIAAPTNFTPTAATLAGMLAGIDAALALNRLAQRSIAGADTVVLADLGKILLLSGTFTLSYTAAATLGAGFWFYAKNTSTGVITHDPSGGELLDGATTVTQQAGIERIIFCTGTAFTSMALQQQNVDNQTFTGSGTWTKHPWAQGCEIDIIGGGGGGGGGRGDAAATVRQSGTGGGGGARHMRRVRASDLSATETVTIGAGGAGGPGGASANGTAGSVGGTSSFGTKMSAFGGGGGGFGAAVTTRCGGGGGGALGAGDAGGTGNGIGGAPGTGNTIDGNGGFGGGGSQANGVGRDAAYGGSGGGGIPSVTGASNAGGNSLYGGAGGGAGGLVSAANTAFAGAAGGATGGAANGGAAGAIAGAGGAGTAGDNLLSGSGGGGGGGNTAGTGGAGAAGGTPGGGGGGGGGGTTTGGAGGAGARGECRVRSFG